MSKDMHTLDVALIARHNAITGRVTVLLSNLIAGRQTLMRDRLDRASIYRVIEGP
jgi:hypothetical protein